MADAVLVEFLALQIHRKPQYFRSHLNWFSHIVDYLVHLPAGDCKFKGVPHTCYWYELVML